MKKQLQKHTSHSIVTESFAEFIADDESHRFRVRQLLRLALHVGCWLIGDSRICNI